MGFYFRKSKNIGGLRFNFSKSGIGVSTGIKGFRVGTGSRGNYIHMGANGIYYRKNFGNKTKNNRYIQNSKDTNVSDMSENINEIDSSDVSNIVDSSSEELVNELNLKSKKFSLKWLSLLFIFLPIDSGVSTLLVFLSLWIFAKIDKKRKNTIIFYDIDEEQEKKIEEFYNSFNDILKSNRKWHIKSKINNYNIKASYGGASSSLDIKPISIRYKTPPHIKTNVKSICIPVGKQNLYFFPDKILIYDKKKVGGLDYRSLNISSCRDNFVWTEGFKPFDSEIISYTYAHVNTNGTPDRRYANNPQIPVLNFTKIHISSNNGLNEEILLSKSNAGEALKLELEKMKYSNNVKRVENNKNNIALQEEQYLEEDDEADPLLNEAIEAIIETQQASTSFIQRRFKIGYARAGKIIDQIEERGIISGYQGSRPREVLMSKQEWEQIKNSNKKGSSIIKTKDELVDKISHLSYIIQIMDNNNLGYKNFIEKIGNEPDDENDTRQVYKFSIFIFINYIVNSNLLFSDFQIIKRYIGTDFGSSTMETEYVFNEVFGKNYKNQKIEPLDWYCFYIQNDELLKNNLLINKKEQIVDTLIEVYKEVGLKIVNNGLDKEERKERYNEYLEYCNNKLNEIKEQVKDTKTAKKEKIETIDDTETLEELIEQLNDLIGLEDVKNDVNSLINLVKVRKVREEKKIKQEPMSLHLVFSGNPGTGKTTVARLIAKIYHKMGVLSNGVFVEADRSELVGGYVGQTAIKVKELCNKALGGLLFVDEAYSLTNNKDSADYGKEALETLLKFMEDHRNNFIVIVAGYTELMEDFLNSNPGLKSRFNKFIHFKDYTPEELLKIYKKLCDDSALELSFEAEQHVKDFFENRYNNRTENFANARDVRNFFEKTLVNQANRIAEDDIITDNELQIIELEDVKNIKLKS